jgi:hypothetical protein
LLDKDGVTVVALEDFACHCRDVATRVAVAGITAAAICVEACIALAISKLRGACGIADRALIFVDLRAVSIVPTALRNVTIEIAKPITTKIRVAVLAGCVPRTEQALAVVVAAC